MLSELDVLGPTLAERLGVTIDADPAPEGLLLGRPGADQGVGSAAWVLYESGDVVLRRSRHEHEVVDAACFHVEMLRDAMAPGLLPLRLRTFLLPDGSALLTTPSPVREIAGLDRRLELRGVTVLPTTVAIVDPFTCELVLPAQTHLPQLSAGRRPISAIRLWQGSEPRLGLADTIVALARAAILDGSRGRQQTLDSVVRFASHELTYLTDFEEIARLASALGSSSRT